MFEGLDKPATRRFILITTLVLYAQIIYLNKTTFSTITSFIILLSALTLAITTPNKKRW